MSPLSPQPPTSSSMTDAPRTRSESMDQLDREQDRKRPRLDLGDLDRGGKGPSDEALTDAGYPADNTNSPSLLPQVNTHTGLLDSEANGEANGEITTHVTSSGTQPSQHSPQQHSHSGVTNMESSPTSTTKPGGTVTINTRPPLSSTTSNSNLGNESAQVEQRDEAEQTPSLSADVSGDKPDLSLDENDPGTASMLPQSPEAHSIRLESKSPEIQVAAPEDIGENGGDTTWHSITSLQPQSQPRLSALDVFAPIEVHTLKELLNHMSAASQAVRLGREHQTMWLQFVKNGLQEYLSSHQQFIYDELDKERIFWISLSTFTENLLTPHPDARLTYEPNDLEEYLTLYAKTTIRILEADSNKLAECLMGDRDDVRWDPLSAEFIPHLFTALQYHGAILYSSLQKQQHWNLDQFIMSLIDLLLNPSNNFFHALSVFVDQVADLLPTVTALAQVFSHTLRLLCRVVDLGSDQKRLSNVIAQESPHHSGASKGFIFKICRTANDAIVKAVSKQLSWLTIDNSSEFLHAIQTTLSALAGQGILDVSDLLNELSVDTAAIDIPEIPEIITTAWKFGILKKYITNGRMELRVHGVETMQTELVRVYQAYINGFSGSCADIPIVKYLLSFLRANKIIEYIVGVDSHPQLISRSGNVIGFFAVTHTYLNTDSDMIWQTVVNSQDSRSVVEVLMALMRIIGLLDASELLYLCSKLLTLPLLKFENRMCEFVMHLTSTLRSKFTEPGAGHADVLPLKVSMRIIRDARVQNGLPSQDVERLRNFAFSQLQLCAELDYPPEDINALCRECLEDINEKNDHAGAAILILLSFVSSRSRYFLPKLVDEFGLTRSIIEELTHTVMCQGEDLNDDSSTLGEINNRIDLLNFVVFDRPESIDELHMDMLWNELFLSKVANGKIQRSALERVSTLLSNRRGPNAFLEKMMHHYFAKVEDRDLTPGLLQFAQSSVQYEIMQSAPILSVPDGPITVPGIERLWRFVTGAVSSEVGDSATKWTINIYLDHHFITQRPKVSIQATHVAIVGRCLRQLESAASRLRAFSDGTMSGEDEPMVIVESEDEINREELRFHRSLIFLKHFLQGLKSRPQYNSHSPQQPSPISPTKSSSIRGEKMMIKYSAHGGIQKSSDQTLVIGAENTGQELAEHLVALTGFTNFNTYSLGHEIRLFESAKTIRELNLRHVLVNKAQDAEEKRLVGRRSHTVSPVDGELITHFSQLFGLLDLEERLAKEIYEFLVLFPTPFTVEEIVKSGNDDAPFILPTSKPYKFLYVLNALRSELANDVLSSNVDEHRILLFAHAIMATISQTHRREGNDGLTFVVASQTLACLLLALQARLSEAASEKLFSDPALVVSYVLHVIKSTADSHELALQGVSVKEILYTSCSVLLEGSMHDRRIWDELPDDLPVLFRQLLLDDTRLEVRQALAEAMYSLSGIPPTKIGRKMAPTNPISARYPAERVQALLVQTWSILSTILPQTCSHAYQSQEVFEVSHAVLRQIKHGLTEGEMANLSREWWAILIGHTYDEVVGRPSRDSIIPGFAKLLLEVSVPRILQNEHIDRKTLLRSVYCGPLFPDLCHSLTSAEVKPKCPILAIPTRADLYDLATRLIQDPVDIEEAVHLVRESLPDIHTYEEFGKLERLALRTAPGFAGLKNLANTCYLNSLFTQLFMNLEFREFIINANVADSSQQGLLSELGKLYAYMQNTWKKWIDPTAVVESIQTFDNTAVDVNIQMDVDEFFNLLFDRLEGQILSPSDKKRFRSFYGGELVQQIKSKECEHVSERIESFSAIQCEIKDKSSLTESLQAYVEGEVMQGDNKYSCTSCNRHVNAVKRACLKDVPDHVIFHLKRFDFDINTMTRCKVNDEFCFPDKIDLTPFKVETLNGSQSEPEPDIFELVGVLVHSGTAETGHYYSYIRERPSSKPAAESWIQYNDSDVSYFDAEKLSECCFGGPDGGSPYKFAKIHSAYMLFYQRVTSIEAFDKKFGQPDEPSPFRLSLPTFLGNHIAMENEIFARAYCAQDASHAYFVRSLLCALPQLSGGSCSENHRLETECLTTTLSYIHHVSSRCRGFPEMDYTLNMLDRRAEDCVKCADAVLKYFESYRGHLPDLMLYHPHREIRSRTVKLIGIAMDNLKTSTRHSMFKSHMERILEFAKKQWPHLHTWTRAFNDFFQLMCKLAGYGPRFVDMMLEDDWFQRCLEIIYIHIGYKDQFKSVLRHTYRGYIKIVDNSTVKPIHFYWFVSFFGELLKQIQLSKPSRTSPLDENEEKVKMSDMEWTLFQPKTIPQKIAFEWLLHLVMSGWNESAVAGIVATLLSQKELSPAVRNTVEYGLYSTAAYHFLNPTLIFIQHCTIIREVERMLTAVLGGFKEIGPDETEFAATLNLERHFSFFISNLIEENTMASGYSWSRILTKTLQHSVSWAPSLLLSKDFEVRRDTQDNLENLIALFNRNENGQSDNGQRQGLITLVDAICVELRSIMTERYANPPDGKAPVSFERGQGDQLQSFLERQMEAFDRDDDEEQALRESIELVLSQYATIASASQFVNDSDDLEFDTGDDADSASLEEIAAAESP